MPKVWNKRDPNCPKDTVYIGRPSKWGNPFRIGLHGDREQVIKLFRMLAEHIMVPVVDQDRTLSIDFGNEEANNWKLVFDDRDIWELQGKDLVCWCAPRPCHGDILLDLANA